MTNLVPDPVGQETSCFSQGSEQAVVSSGVFMDSKVGINSQPSAQLVPIVSRGRAAT